MSAAGIATRDSRKKPELVATGLPPKKAMNSPVMKLAKTI